VTLIISPPKANLEGWWKCDESSGTRDDSGFNQLHLSPLPNAVAQSTTIKRLAIGSAGLFATDGLVGADSALTPTFPGKNGGSTGAFTAGCFVHPAAAGSGSDYIICKDGSFLLYYANTGNKISAQIGASAAIAANTTQATGQWHCAAIRWDGLEFSLWIAGVKQTAVTAVTSLVHNANPFVLGAQDSSGTNFLNGYINDAFVFSRALSDSEMRKISMVGPTAFFTPIMGLLGSWPMDEAAGSTRYDISPGLTHLAENGTVPQQTALFKEGTASAGKFSTTPSCLKCADADLPAGFPWKNSGAAIEWTIGAWLYQDTTTATCVYKKGTAIELQWGNPAPGLYGLLFNNTLILVSPSVAIQTWKHIVVRWRGEDDDQAEYIIDGVKQAGGSGQAANAGNATDFLVGAQTTLPTLPMQGYIDEAFVFNRALADEEILEIYTGGLSSFVLPSFGSGLVQGAPAKGRKIPRPNLKYPARGQRTGGVSGGGRRKGSGARW